MRAALVVLALALAGCSTGGDPPAATQLDSVDAASAGDLDAGGLSLNATGVTVTDTLYLALPARLNTTSPANVTILGLLSGPLAQSFAWNATLNGTGTLQSARLSLWIDLQNSAVQTGLGGDPACSASLTLVFVANNTTLVQPGGCATLGTGLIPAGEHLLELSTPITVPSGVELRPGDQVVAQVAFGFGLPQGVGHVLGGGDHASALRLAGLAEPVQSAATPLL